MTTLKNNYGAIKALAPELSVSAKSLHASTEPWPDPQPLPSELSPVQKFDLTLLPVMLHSWIKDIAERIQCPIDFVAVTAMVVASGVLGRRIGVRPKQRDDWLVVPNLWGAVIGRPGVMKTPAISEPLNMLKRLEIKAKDEYRDKAGDFEAAKIVADAKKKAKKKEVEEAVRNDGNALALAKQVQQEEPSAPIRRRHLLNDPTVEKLGELLNQNPNGLTIHRDELIGFLKSLDKNGQESARAFYLESWNGTGRFTYDRIGRGTIDIDAAIVSIIGGIQPGPLSAYLRAAVEGQGGDDGLMQRFQMTVWPDISKEWRNVDEFPDTKAKQTAYAVYQRLRDLDPTDIGAEVDDYEPDGIPFLRFDSAAQNLFDQWRTGLEGCLRSGDEHPAIESHLAKYRSLVPSLALLVHLVDEPRGGPISVEAITRAIHWSHYLESHARRLYSAVTAREVQTAKKILNKIAGGKLCDGFALRNVYHKQWAGLSDRDDVAAGVALLIDLDYLRETSKPTKSRPRTRYLVNPNFYESIRMSADKTDKSPPFDGSVGSDFDAIGVSSDSDW